MRSRLARATQAARIASLMIAVAVPGCDDREAWHEPEPGLERMLDQHRADPYEPSAAFDDGRVMRMPPPDTVPRERAYAGQPLVTTGHDGTHEADVVPIPVTRDILLRGRSRFDTVCATCHGVLGDAVTVVAEKMALRKPTRLDDPRVRALSPGRVFAIVSAGYGLMPGYAPMWSVEERWAVVAYLDALRLSQHANVGDLPPEDVSALAKEAP